MTGTPFHTYYTAKVLESFADDDKFIPSYASSDILVYPYQLAAATFATRSPYLKGVVLMDESGLGKSTEAMLVVTQKWYEGKNRIIIIVPNADLLMQWENLIKNKYSVPFVSLYSSAQLSTDGNPFEQDALVLTTFDFAVQNADLVSQIKWDVSVFEEASLLSSVYKPENKQARVLKDITEDSFRVLLTGTPIEKNILDLYGLMYFIDETILPSEQEYMSRYFRKPENYPELAALVSKYCFRTLRSQAKQYAKIPDRLVITCEFEYSPVEQELYNAIQNYIEKPQKIAFPEMEKYDLALMLFDLYGSSSAAVKKSFESIISRLKKTDGAENEIKEFEYMRLLADEIKEDTKFTILKRNLDEIFKLLKRGNANKKAVIFTENRETQNYLYDNLSEKYKTYIYNGSKDYRAIEGFVNDGEIIISTDQGSRGLCLEIASLVINYDLLYNTLKMEQRINRCHRLSQLNDVIVLNFLNKSNMADVRKLELVNKRMLVADGVFGLSDQILGGFTDNISETVKTLNYRTQAQISNEYDRTLKAFETENKREVETAEEMLFTTFTPELAKKIKITPEYVADKSKKINDDLWAIIKEYFEDYNDTHDDCRFLTDDLNRTVIATDYDELPDLFYYYTGGRNKRYKALKEFKKITLVSPLAKGILSNTECADSGTVTVSGNIGPCKIAFYGIDIIAGNTHTGKTYQLLCGMTDDGSILTNDECLDILAMPVISFEENGRRSADWLKSRKPGNMDKLIPIDELIENTVKDRSSAQAEEIEHIKRKATVDKSNLEHNLSDLKNEITILQKQLESITNDRMSRLVLERKIGDAKNKLLSSEENIYFEAMRIDLACEESIKQFLEKEKISAKLLKHFEINIRCNS